MKSTLLLLSFLFSCIIRCESYETKGEAYYKEADSLLSSFNTQSTNIAHIQYLLEESVSEEYTPAISKLGELYLFGLPSTSSVFARDTSKAFEYLSLAHLKGDEEAPVLLNFMKAQGVLLEEFAHVRTFENSNLSSSYARGVKLSDHMFCVRSLNLPLPLHLSDMHTQCESCDSQVYNALVLGKEAINHIQSEGSVDTIPELLYWYKPRNEKTLTLHSKVYQEKGDSQGMVSIGDSYLHGDPHLNLEKDPLKAKNFYEKAAETGNPHALENLGAMYMNGVGTAKNYTKALEYLEKAGTAHAMNGLGYFYLNGIGVPVNYSLAFHYYKKSADMGDHQGLSNLGVAYLNGYGTPKNYSLAFESFEIAAKSGQLNAIFNLGVLYYRGIGVDKSCTKALKLFQEIYSRGPMNKFIRRAYSFYNQGDIAGAYLSFAFAGHLGLKNGQINAAFLWEKGLPFNLKVHKNRGAADLYARAAVEYDSEFAYLRLAHLAYYGYGMSLPNYKEAFQFYSRANNFDEALFATAYMTEYGLGVKRDVDLAENMYLSLAYKHSYAHETYPAFISLVFLKFKKFFVSVELFDRLFNSFSRIFF